MDSQKDDKNRQTSYMYDEFGRSKKTTYADGRWEEGSLNWVSAPSTASYCVTQTSSTDPTVKTYFDALDRVVRKS
ncbi:hypothetical protein [Parabacteroides pacaensis]|uniref:hypothetical protein n=1 Tax=Parabacteroides pacaensis TaxID=2086575 RepID=UPI00131DC3DD|nr:hypothetical protein [Parabacteroides pacaensis]